MKVVWGLKMGLSLSAKKNSVFFFITQFVSLKRNPINTPNPFPSPPPNPLCSRRRMRRQLCPCIWCVREVFAPAAALEALPFVPLRV